MEGLTTSEASARIQAHLASNEQDQAIAEGIAWFFEENGHDREALMEFLAQAGLAVESAHAAQDAMSDDAAPEPEEERVVPFQPKQDDAASDAKPNNTRTWIQMAAAIAVLIGFGAMSSIFSGSSASKLVSQHLETPYEAPEVWRGDETP